MKENKTVSIDSLRTAASEHYPLLSALVQRAHQDRRDEVTLYVACGYESTWAEEDRTDSDRGLRQYSTPARWTAYTEGRITRDKAVTLATQRALAEVDKSEVSQYGKLCAAVRTLAWADISVEWVRSSTWGYNPHATLCTDSGRTEGRASGCGYDKRSAAVAEALNKCPAALRILYDAAERALQAGNEPSGTANGGYTVLWQDVLGHGTCASIVPRYEGGVGVNCYWRIMRAAGYTVRANERAKYNDHYTISGGGDQCI